MRHAWAGARSARHQSVYSTRLERARQRLCSGSEARFER
jgi:hypothetical protein